MSLQMRLPRSLYDVMQADLRRPHAFASERVGFLYGRLANAHSDHPIILMTAYVPLGNDRYVRDLSVGARIDSAAIRSAMQGVIDRGEGVFHTHLHAWPGRPSFGLTDRAELPRLVSSFQTVGRGQAHGLFLLSDNEACADVWLPGQKSPATACRITIVGFPMSLIEA
jgi:hypothetical protein